MIYVALIFLAVNACSGRVTIPYGQRNHGFEGPQGPLVTGGRPNLIIDPISGPEHAGVFGPRNIGGQTTNGNEVSPGIVLLPNSRVSVDNDPQNPESRPIPFPGTPSLVINVDRTGQQPTQGVIGNPRTPGRSTGVQFPGISFVSVVIPTTLTHTHFSTSTIHVRNDVTTTNVVTITEFTTRRVYVPGPPRKTTVTPVVTETSHVLATATVTTVVNVLQTTTSTSVHFRTKTDTLIRHFTTIVTAYSIDLRPVHTTVTLDELLTSTTWTFITKTSILPYGVPSRAYH